MMLCTMYASIFDSIESDFLNLRALGQCVRVVKESDSKSDGLCPQGFESPRCRYCVSLNKKVWY